MTDTLKVLAQSNPSADALTDVYTVPVATSAAVSSISVCNTGNLSATFRVAVAVAGAADAVKQYIYYDVVVEAYTTFVATIGLTLATTDVVRVYTSRASLAFNIFGVEIT